MTENLGGKSVENPQIHFSLHAIYTGLLVDGLVLNDFDLLH